MDAMPVLARLVLALDLLQAGFGGDVIEDILDLSGSDVTITVTRKEPALRAAGKLLCYGLGNLRQQYNSTSLLELGIKGRDVQVTFTKVHIFSPDLGHLTCTQASSGQEEYDTTFSVIPSGS
jgi:hypothetical protein